MNEPGVATRVTGWVLLLPAAVLTVITLVVPTIQTISQSFSSQSFLPRAESEDVGFDNYSALFGDFWPSVGFALSLVVMPILVAVVVGPLVAAALSWAGGWARVTARVVLSLTLVVFSPVALALAWNRELADDPGSLADSELVNGTVRLSVLMMTFGVMCAVGVMVFLPVFRAREQRRPMWPALFATAGVVALGLIAVGLQQFTVPFVMTHFGPRNQTLVPVGQLYVSAFQQARLGMGAAVGTMLLLFLAVLGVAAALVVVLTRLRVSVLPRRQPVNTDPAFLPAPSARANPGAIVLAALVLAAVVAVIVVNALPWLDSLSGQDPELAPGTQRRTWFPAASGAVVSVGVAYLAALGISGLRPLGRRSEWLLLPFAPWLFVGVAPFAATYFASLRDDSSIGTEGALHQPILVSVVSLMILAILCRGQSERWQRDVAMGVPAGDSFFRVVVAPTLPLAGFLFVVTTYLNAQNVLWPLLVAPSPDDATAPLTLLLANNGFAAQDVSVAAATPLVAVVLGALALVAAQVFHLDRMVAATGRPAAESETASARQSLV